MQNIATINDALRQSLPCLPKPHKLFLTDAVAALPPTKLHNLFEAIKSIKNFDSGNDPYAEHDYGYIVADGGESYFWKFDYYDNNFEFFKENGSRTLTIMTASEY